MNKLGGAVEMMGQIKEASITQRAAVKLSAEELKGKIVRGVFHHDTSRPEYTALYRQIQEEAGGARLADERIHSMEIV
jgi:2-oxoglutarate ferredoxin oxidoreductase subunit beta